MRIEFLNELAQDTAYTLRSLRKAPAFALVAILTLALGIGANTAIFSVVRGILLRPLPFADPGRLVMVASSGYGSNRAPTSPANAYDQGARQSGVHFDGRPLRAFGGAHRLGRARENPRL